MRTFAYCRVSTTEQTTDNQVLQLKTAGYDIPAHRIVAEQVSASIPATERDGFKSLLNKLESGDALIVTKLDRLGRNVVDVITTITHLQGLGVKVISLDLGNTDLATAAGQLQLNVLAAVAQFERTRLIERTNDGLARAKADGKVLGRKPLPKAQIASIQALKAEGKSQSQVVTKTGLSLSTIKRNWNI